MAMKYETMNPAQQMKTLSEYSILNDLNKEFNRQFFHLAVKDGNKPSNTDFKTTIELLKQIGE